MTLVTKCALYIVVLCSMFVHCSWPDSESHNDVSDESDDEKKIKQALIIVDLLKHEFIRTLRENRELRAVDKSKSTTIVEEESTCATTDQSTLTIGTTKFATKKPTTTATVVMRKNINTKPKKKPPPSTRSIELRSYRRAGGVKPQSSQQISPHMSSETERKNLASDVQAQVASELLSEIKIEQELMLKKSVKTIKPTLKIHLGGSTRLPIPLPENHAFCYTNPRSSLCRTSI